MDADGEATTSDAVASKATAAKAKTKWVLMDIPSGECGWSLGEVLRHATHETVTLP
jgi:hypothetical protein